MRNLKPIRYYSLFSFMVCMWIAHSCCSMADFSYESLSRNPLDGSTERWPGKPARGRFDERGVEVSGKSTLTRLLDVGAVVSVNISTTTDPGWSFVPPLDGTSPLETLSQNNYAMKIVLFDLQLLELKSVDAVGGSFQVEFRMLLHWVESTTTKSRGMPFGDDCRFPCDTSSPELQCCDGVWVPPLRLPRCDINSIQSSTPDSYLFVGDVANCATQDGVCIWRRVWYLTIDATCASKMDFRKFPFDKQRLTINILNPYASRTWFQYTQGILQQNVGANVNLPQDVKISGWSIEDLLVSRTCNAPKSWSQTFLNQDSLLSELSETYQSQKDAITESLQTPSSTCSSMDDLNNGTGDIDFSNYANYEIYENARSKFLERLDATLEAYQQCTKTYGKPFSWNLSLYADSQTFPTGKFGEFHTTEENVNRTFNILHLYKSSAQPTVFFPCVISAVANLTTPGIQFTIIVKRFSRFYVVKLILPTVACVIFSFTAFAVDLENLVGRLTIVVPSAIALTALQGFVVSTDIPPVAYTAPSTNIFIMSYIVQILISFESISVRSKCSKSASDRRQRSLTLSRRSVANAPTMNAVSRQSYAQLSDEEEDPAETATRTAGSSLELVAMSSGHEQNVNNEPENPTSEIGIVSPTNDAENAPNMNDQLNDATTGQDQHGAETSLNINDQLNNATTGQDHYDCKCVQSLSRRAIDKICFLLILLGYILGFVIIVIIHP